VALTSPLPWCPPAAIRPSSARVALRAAVSTAFQNEHGDAAHTNGHDSGHNALHNRIRNEVLQTMNDSLQRRTKRLQDQLCGRAGALQLPMPDRKGRPCVSDEVQTQETGPLPNAYKLSAAVASALEGAAKAAEPPSRAYGPSRNQAILNRKRGEPPEEHKDPIEEYITLSDTAECLSHSLGSREKQLQQLKKQLEHCQGYYSEICKEAGEVLEQRKLLEQHPNDQRVLREVQSDRLELQRERVTELGSKIQKVEESGMRCWKLVRQQKAYFKLQIALQDARPDALQKNRAGELFLPQQPPPMFEEQATSFDVGTYIANPYVCDTWPFEPNVLAQRTSMEAPLPKFREETEADLEAENRHTPPCVPSMNFPLQMPRRDPRQYEVGSDDDDEIDDDDEEEMAYRGQTETSRSL